MKNKRNTYLLLASVVIIWGIIIYKMIGAVSPDSPIAETEIVLAGFTPKPLQQQEVFSTSEHQRDPFLGGFITPKTKKTSAKTRKSVPKPEKPQISIRFSGMISGKTAQDAIFFVSVNDQQHMMKPGDEIQGVKLLKGTAKTIRVRYNGQFKTIPITP